MLPEMQRLMEGPYGMKPEDFTKIYSLGQFAPGPNMSMVVVLGYRMAGMWGALTVLVAFFLPASILCFTVGRVWERAGDSPWRRAIQDGLAPIAIGLMLSGVGRSRRRRRRSLMTIVPALIVVALMLRTKINPVFLVLACGIFGGFLLPRG